MDPPEACKNGGLHLRPGSAASWVALHPGTSESSHLSSGEALPPSLRARGGLWTWAPLNIHNPMISNETDYVPIWGLPGGLLPVGGNRWVLLRVCGPDVPSESGCVSQQVTW